MRPISTRRRAVLGRSLLLALPAFALLTPDLAASPADDARHMVQAAREGRPDRVGVLLDAGVPVDAKDQGRTALIAAAASNRTDIVSFLAGRGADINIRSQEGDTALSLAADLGLLDSVETLLAEGAGVDIVDSRGRTPLIKAVHGALRMPLEHGADHMGIILLLLDKGASPDKQDKKGWTALMTAAAQGEPEIVDMLLRYGADAAPAMPDGKTARDLAEPLGTPGHRASAKLLAEVERAAKLRRKDPSLAAQVRDAETAGDAAAAKGQHAAALSQYSLAVSLLNTPVLQSILLRRKVIQAALSMKPAPTDPAAAVRHARLATAGASRGPKSPGFKAAVVRFEYILKTAPWWGNAYFNLGILYDKMGDARRAIACFELCLLAEPSNPNAGAIRRRITELKSR